MLQHPSSLFSTGIEYQAIEVKLPQPPFPSPIRTFDAHWSKISTEKKRQRRDYSKSKCCGSTSFFLFRFWRGASNNGIGFSVWSVYEERIASPPTHCCKKRRFNHIGDAKHSPNWGTDTANVGIITLSHASSDTATNEVTERARSQ